MGDGRLTESMAAQLGAVIRTDALEQTALIYLGFRSSVISNLRTKHRENIQAVNRDVLKMWANGLPRGYNQCKVSTSLFERSDSCLGHVDTTRLSTTHQ